MHGIDDLLHKAIYGKVKWKRNSTQSLRFIASKVANKRSIEVMLKITGHSKAGVGGNLEAHIKYISRNEKLEIEDDNGTFFSGKEDTKKFVEQWQREIDANKPRSSKKGNDTMHLVLSMPNEVKPEAVQNATRDFLKKNFYNHEYLFVLHTDAKGENPHTHCVIKTLGFDNSKLNPNRKDLQIWREAFAAEMQNQGVENAEATPRKTRGVVKKTEKQLIRYAELAIDKDAKSKESERERLTGEQKKAWLDAANALKNEPLPDDKKLAREIEQYLADMEADNSHRAVTERQKRKSKSREDDLER